MEITNKDYNEVVNKEALESDKRKQEILSKTELKGLYEDIINAKEKDTSIVDVKKIAGYLTTIKDKPRSEITKEGSAWTFAIQLFLKWAKMYTGKIDGIYGTPGSKTYEAVKSFQKKYNIPVDGKAGKVTISTMLRLLQSPELSEAEIKDTKITNDQTADVKTYFGGELKGIEVTAQKPVAYDQTADVKTYFGGELKGIEVVDTKIDIMTPWKNKPINITIGDLTINGTIQSLEDGLLVVSDGTTSHQLNVEQATKDYLIVYAGQTSGDKAKILNTPENQPITQVISPRNEIEMAATSN